jgi:hypothetical protein
MIRGYLEALSADRCQGWAFDDADPALRLAVRILRGSRVIGHSATGIFRADLQDWGDGQHGFAVDLPQPLSDEEATAIVAEASRPGTDQWQFLPRFLSREAAEEAVPPRLGSAAVNASPAGSAYWSDDPCRGHAGSEVSLPVFITGAVRSGTSALFAALVAATRYRGFYEGHVLDLAAGLMTAVQAHLDEKYALLPDDAIREFHLGRYRYDRLQASIRSLLRRLTTGYTTAFWVDKTPSIELVRSVPLLAQTWPEARFVFMMRRGLENVMSQLRKFSRADFEESCRRWAQIMAEWRRVRPSIPGKFVEVEQRSLRDDPRGAAGLVGTLLQLSGHEIAGLAAQLAHVRIEVTDPAEQIVATMTDTGWSDEMIATFHKMCGSEMEAYGYTDDERYRR